MSSNTDKTEFEKMLERKVREEEEAVAAAQAEQAAQEPVAEDAATAAPATDDSSVADKELKERTEECEQLRDQLLRARAEFDNYRKRILREMDQLRQTAASNLVRALLPVVDNLERALAHSTAADSFAEGVAMVSRQLQDVLASQGLEAIPDLNEIFDPNVHEALASMPSETVASGCVMEEYERGYRMGGMVVRPSRVIVSSGPPETESADAATESEEDIENALTDA